MRYCLKGRLFPLAEDEELPELRAPYGYLVVTVASLLIVLAEIWFFRRKRWLE